MSESIIIRNNVAFISFDIFREYDLSNIVRRIHEIYDNCGFTRHKSSYGIIKPIESFLNQGVHNGVLVDNKYVESWVYSRPVR